MENQKRIIGYIDNYPEDRTEHYEFLTYMLETHSSYMRRVISEFYLPDIVYSHQDFTVVEHDFEFPQAEFFLVFNKDTNIVLPANVPVLLIITDGKASFTTRNVHVIQEIDLFCCIRDHLISMRFPWWHDFILKRVQEYCDKAIAQLSKPSTNLLTFNPQSNGNK